MSDAPLEQREGLPPRYLEEVVREVKLFFTTLRDFTSHPFRFCRDWGEGRAQAMNPVAFWGAALGLQLGAAALRDHFAPGSAEDTALERDLKAAAPHLAWAIDLLRQQLELAAEIGVAAVVHWRLRKKGSTQSFQGTLGALLFADGWSTLATAAAIALAIAWPAAAPLQSALHLVGLVLDVVAIAGVHRLRRLRSAVGPLLLAAALTSLVVAGAVAGLQAPELARKLRERAARKAAQATKENARPAPTAPAPQ
jgi:hypothetical protein